MSIQQLSYNQTASRAIDGNLDQTWAGGSVTHTTGDEEDLDPWWSLTLAQAQEVEHIRIFNRNDCCGSRLSNAIVELYNDEGDITYSHNLGAAEDVKEVFLGGTYVVKSVKIQVSSTAQASHKCNETCHASHHTSFAVAWLQGFVACRGSAFCTRLIPSRARLRASNCVGTRWNATHHLRHDDGPLDESLAVSKP